MAHRRKSKPKPKTFIYIVQEHGNPMFYYVKARSKREVVSAIRSTRGSATILARWTISRLPSWTILEWKAIL